MSQEALALAANSTVAKAITDAGGSLPNLAAITGEAEAKALKLVFDAAVATATGVIQGATALATSLANEAAELAVKAKKNSDKQAELARARAYFGATNNIFPLQKLCGVPTSAAILARHPDIEKIPADFGSSTTSPATTAAPSSGSNQG